ncbi:MAG TPA: hypothetical protein VFZ95_12610 [Steroidobacteraceae bacterium]
MFKGSRIIGASAVLAFAFAAQAFAQASAPGNCIELKTTAEVEKEVVNEKGEKSKVLSAATTVVPGTEVVLTVTANNVCKQPSDKVVINNPVPEHMTLVPGSVIGAGSDITYSVDGKTFAPAGKLTITVDGATRSARAEEYRHIRWEFKNSLAPGASAFGRFRAVLN